MSIGWLGTAVDGGDGDSLVENDPDDKYCDHCGSTLAPDDGTTPKSSRSWCSMACGDAATADEPGWIRIADMTPLQRAELDHFMTPASEKGPAS